MGTGELNLCTNQFQSAVILVYVMVLVKDAPLIGGRTCLEMEISTSLTLATPVSRLGSNLKLVLLSQRTKIEQPLLLFVNRLLNANLCKFANETRCSDSLFDKMFIVDGTSW